MEFSKFIKLWVYRILYCQVVCISTAYCGLLACAQSPNVTQPPRIARSLAELNKLQVERPEVAHEFDVEAKLAFATKSWTVFYVQDGNFYHMVECTDAVSNLLSQHSPGTRIHMRGYSARFARTLKMYSIELISGENSLEITRVESLSLNLPSIEAYVEITPLIESAFIGTDSTLLSGKLGNSNVLLELYQVLSPEAAQLYLGADITARGALTKSSNRWLGEDFKLRMMREDQMTASSKVKSSSSDPGLARIYGQVVFTNHLDRLVLRADKTIHEIRSNFAPRFKIGHWVSAYVAQLESAEPSECRLMKFHAEAELGKATDLIENEPIESRALPGLYSIVADIANIQPASGGFTIAATRANTNLDVHLYSPKSSSAELGIRMGDRVRFVGTLAAVTPKKSKIAKHQLFVPDESGVKYLSSPTSIAPQILGWTIGLGVLLSFFFIGWNRSLQSRVHARTKQLDQISSHLRESFEAIREAILICNHENKIVASNSRFQTIFGVRPNLGQSLTDVLRVIESQSSDLAAVRTCFLESLSGSKREIPTTITVNGASTIQYYTTPILGKNGVFQGHLWAFEDITERLALEAKLIQSQKMEAIGKLSGGVAHDFNNLLNVMRATLTNLAFLRNSSSANVPLEQESIQIAQQAVDRAAELTQQLLDFSRRSNLELTVVDINVVAERASKFARRVISPSVPIQLFLSHSPTYAAVDSSRLEQVILNLIINAKDALPNGEGEIGVSTALVSKEGKSFAQIQVTDNGAGIAPEILSRIFEPFFTTKTIGEGTGLGLSMAIGVIEQMHGSIECRSEVNVGSTFTIQLPHANSAESSQVFWPPSKTIPDTNQLPQDTNQRSLKLLLVDDEPMIRKAVAAMLKIMGHDVETAENGSEALSKFSTNQFDLILLDLAMPGISGAQVLDQIRAVDSRTPVIICTGDATNLAVAEGMPPPWVLKKPYRKQELAEAISSALAAPIPSSPKLE